MGEASRRRSRLLVGLVAAGAVLLASGFSCDDQEPAAVDTITDQPGYTPPPVPQDLTGEPLTRPTGLRLVAPPYLIDVDADATVELATVSGWLARPGRDPLLLADSRPDMPGEDDFFLPVTITLGTEPDLSASLEVVVVSGSPFARLAASADGAGVWVVEYLNRSDCTLRELSLTGASRRAARSVECGVRPLAETSHGLWMQEDVNAFTASDRAALPGDVVLLEPDSLAEMARFPAAELLDDDRVLTFANRHRGGALALRDLRTGETVSLSRPELDGTLMTGGVSPDGRYLAVVFSEMSQMPPTVDVWVLDLTDHEWQRLPSMPAHGAVRNEVVAGWAPDGRMVLLGQFRQGPGGFETQLAVWRVGDDHLSLMDYPYRLGRMGTAQILSAKRG